MTATKNDIVFKERNRAKVRKHRKKRSYYYAFGLTMSGISSKAAGGIQNKYKFNGGNELQNQEFSEVVA